MTKSIDAHLRLPVNLDTLDLDAYSRIFTSPEARIHKVTAKVQSNLVDLEFDTGSSNQEQPKSSPRAPQPFTKSSIPPFFCWPPDKVVSASSDPRDEGAKNWNETQALKHNLAYAESVLKNHVEWTNSGPSDFTASDFDHPMLKEFMDRRLFDLVSEKSRKDVKIHLPSATSASSTDSSRENDNPPQIQGSSWPSLSRRANDEVFDRKRQRIEADFRLYFQHLQEVLSRFVPDGELDRGVFRKLWGELFQMEQVSRCRMKRVFVGISKKTVEPPKSAIAPRRA